MQKWEYLLVGITLGPVGGGNKRIRYLNELELTDWKRSGPSLRDYLNGLGDEGWELVNNEVPSPDYSYWVFKRPKP